MSEPQKYVRPAYEDLENSVDLFDTNRKNDFGDDYCVAATISPTQIEGVWKKYVDDLFPVQAFENPFTQPLEDHTDEYDSISQIDFDQLTDHEIELIVDELQTILRRNRLQNQ